MAVTVSAETLRVPVSCYDHSAVFSTFLNVNLRVVGLWSPANNSGLGCQRCKVGPQVINRATRLPLCLPLCPPLCIKSCRCMCVCLMCTLSLFKQNLAMWQLPAGLCGGVDAFICALEGNCCETIRK